MKFLKILSMILVSCISGQLLCSSNPLAESSSFLFWEAELGAPVEVSHSTIKKYLFLKDNNKQRINPRIELKALKSLTGSYHTLTLWHQGVKVGESRFNFCRKDKRVFVETLFNHSIVKGERVISGVGSSLLNIIKFLTYRLKFKSVVLVAQFVCHVEHPKENNLLAFYQKNGFDFDDESRDLYSGVRMMWVPQNGLNLHFC